MKKLFLLVCFFLIAFPVLTQNRVEDTPVDERDLYAMTKQISQFFSRFNNEEDPMGVKYLTSAPQYRNQELRKNVLPILFDSENLQINGKLRDLFIDAMVASDSNFLSFNGGKWYAEVTTTFEYKKKEVDIILDLVIEQAQYGSKWVITNVTFSEYEQMFEKNVSEKTKSKYFLHPMSHELDFMNIYKAFQKPDYVEFYASSDYKPDYLSMFFYDIKRGNLKFISVKTLKFHVFQLKDWYFEISWFNRTGTNAGWLISNLLYIPEIEKDALIQLYQP